MNILCVFNIDQVAKTYTGVSAAENRGHVALRHWADKVLSSLQLYFHHEQAGTSHARSDSFSP